MKVSKPRALSKYTLSRSISSQSISELLACAAKLSVQLQENKVNIKIYKQHYICKSISLSSILQPWKYDGWGLFLTHSFGFIREY